MKSEGGEMGKCVPGPANNWMRQAEVVDGSGSFYVEEDVEPLQCHFGDCCEEKDKDNWGCEYPGTKCGLQTLEIMGSIELIQQCFNEKLCGQHLYEMGIVKSEITCDFKSKTHSHSSANKNYKYTLFLALLTLINLI